MSTRVKQEWVTITPAIAEGYLAKNKENRPIRTRKVDRYAQVMLRGQWKRTHQGIAFDNDGRLIDGQHRLKAIIQSGVSQEILVTHGLEADVYAAIDTGATRNDVDRLSYAGYGTVSLRAAAACRTMLHAAGDLVMSRGRSNTHEVFDSQDYLDYYEKHHKAIAFALQDVTPTRGLYNAAVVAVVSRAWYTADRARLKQFLEVFSTGLSHSQKDAAAIRLRNFSLTQKRKDARSGEYYFKVQSALDKFLKGQDIDKLYPASVELFPVPGDNRIQRLVESRKADMKVEEPEEVAV